MDESSAGQAAEKEPSAEHSAKSRPGSSAEQAAGSGSSAGKAAGSGSSAGQAAGSGSSAGQAAASAAKGQSAEQSPNRSFKTSMNTTLSSDKPRNSSELSEGAKSEDVYTDADDDFVMVGAQEKPAEEVSEKSPEEGPKLSKRQRKNKNKKSSSESKPPAAASASKKPESEPKETERKPETSEKSAKGSSKTQNKADKQKSSDSNSKGSTSPTKKLEGNLEKLGKGIAESGTQMEIDDSSVSGVSHDRKGSQSKDVVKVGEKPTSEEATSDENSNVEGASEAANVDSIKVSNTGTDSSLSSGGDGSSASSLPSDSKVTEDLTKCDQNVNKPKTNENSNSGDSVKARDVGKESTSGMQTRQATKKNSTNDKGTQQQQTVTGKNSDLQSKESDANSSNTDHSSFEVDLKRREKTDKLPQQESDQSATNADNNLTDDKSSKGLNYAGAVKSDASASNNNSSDSKGNEKKKNGNKTQDAKGKDAKSPTPSNQSGEVSKSANSNQPVFGAGKAGKKILVHFHVILPVEEFKYKEDDKVVVKFDHTSLGGFESNEHVMKRTRRLDEKLSLFVGDILIPENVSYNLQYKYAVKRQESSKTKTIKWEYIGDKSDGNPSRTLKMLKDKLMKDKEWNQYDGVMLPHPEKKGTVQTLVNKFKGLFFKEKSNLTKIAGKAMLPEWSQLKCMSDKKDSEGCGELFLEQVTQVCYCIGPGFRTEDASYDNLMLKEMLMEYINEELVSFPLEPQRGLVESKREGGIRLAIACCIIHLSVNYHLDCDKDATNRILTALLLRLDTATNRCEDYEQLVKVYFPTEKWQKTIAGNLLLAVCNLVNSESLTSGIQPKWLFAVPLMHLLYKQSIPYRYPSHIETSHDHQTGAWWGIGNPEFKKIVDKFKTHLRNRPDDYLKDFYLEWLGPLFKVDQLLPRTLLSVMSVEHLPRLLDSGLFPVDALLANCCYFIRTDIFFFLKVKLLPILQKISGMIDNNVKFTDDSGKDNEEDLMIYLRSQHDIASTVFIDLFDKCDLHDPAIFVESVKIVAKAIIHFSCHMDFPTQSKTSGNNSCVSDLSGTNFYPLLNNIDVWLSKNLYRKIFNEFSTYDSYSKEEFQIYTELMDIEFPNIDMNSEWQKHLKQFVQNRLLQISEEDRVNVFCSVNFEAQKYSEKLESIFSLAAFSALETPCVLQTGKFRNLFEATGNTFQAQKISDLLSKMFERSWPSNANEGNDSEAILQHMLTWPSFPKFLTLFYGKEQKMKFLSEKCQTGIFSALSVFDDTILSLLNGQVKVVRLKRLKEKSSNFLEFFALFEENSESGCANVPEPAVEGMKKVEVLELVLKWRVQELDAFLDQTNLVRCFVDYCTNLKIKCVDTLLRRVVRADNSDQFSMLEFCKPQVYSASMAKQTKLNVRVTYYDLTEEVVQMMIDVKNTMKSTLFRIFWNEECHKMSAKAANADNFVLDDIVKHVWIPATHRWGWMCQALKSGELTLYDLDKLLQKLGCDNRNRNNSSVILREFESMCGGNTKIARTRVEEMERYFQLENCHEGAQLMLNLRQAFGLTGNFKDAEMLENLDKSKEMNTMTAQLLKYGKALQDISPAKRECLQVFLNNTKFVNWLKKSMKGPKEVKVLVDLAMISAAGQGDLEVHKVSCLHAAATGYAPLIYDLKPTNCDFHQFLNLCELVWQNLKADPDLPKKFSDTARQLEWLDRVKKSHGSAEVNALTNVQSINARGIYTVGAVSANMKKCLDEMISLKVSVDPSEKGTGCQSKAFEVFDVQRLNDLQNKLMLVVGKSTTSGIDEERERFVEMFDGVTRLANIYIKLCAAGCTLFQNFRTIFYCEPARKGQCTRIEFSRNHGFWAKGEGRGVLDHVTILSDLMEDCLKEWMQHISDCRDKHTVLNHYTTAQLVLLQNELAKVVKHDDPNPADRAPDAWVYQMLESVKRNCKQNDLDRAMREMFVKLANDEKRKSPVDDDVDDDDDDDDDEDDDDNESDYDDQETEEEEEEEKLDEEQQKALQDFIDFLKDSSFSERLAKRAYREVGLDKDLAFMWCMEHVNDDEDSDDDVKHDDQSKSDDDVDNKNDDDDDGSVEETSVDPQEELPVDYSGLLVKATKSSFIDSLFEKQQTSASDTFSKNLRDVWVGYKSEKDKSVSDFLSLPHLGLLLESLKDEDTINRPMPNGLSTGKPNLVVCDSADILPTVLSLYMYGEGSRLPLPSADEILMCNEHTTAEQVELLWRRVVSNSRDDGGRMYTLLGAERLDYEVSRSAELSLLKFCNGANDIRLVVLCCGGEHEERCHMINALEKFRVRLAQPDLSDVRDYLKSHLTVEDVRGLPSGVRPASQLDPERCCTRVIKSHRAGVGKSLKVQRYIEEMMRWRMPYGAPCKRIPLHCRAVDSSSVVETLRQHVPQPGQVIPKIFHIDIAHEVLEGVDYLLFNLLVLGSLTDNEGFVWCRSNIDYYVVETLPLMQQEVKAKDQLAGRHAQPKKTELQYVHQIFNLLPSITCWSPEDSLLLLTNRRNELEARYRNVAISEHDQLMDNESFTSEVFQRPFQYLQRYQNGGVVFNDINCKNVQGNAQQCIDTLLRHCGVRDPSWAELRHFAGFLNIQLAASERSVFCSAMLADDMPGFLHFVVRFMIQMSKDFATRSLAISEETPEVSQRILNDDNNENAAAIIELYGLKRRWETSPHPYLFFNGDSMSFTFMGFIVERRTGNILEPGTNRVLDPGAVPEILQNALYRNNVNMQENFDLVPRLQKIIKMCSVMGLDMFFEFEPDISYELTADNVKKILAIYMRFRCNIPVIIMGETGCGKTRLVKFMCDLWKPLGSNINNMILMKVHGGTTEEEIRQKVDKSVKLAEENSREFEGVKTVLFFDEANTTEGIGLIKEIMCDGTMNGAPVNLGDNLKLIAACNPYRKHSENMIRHLEKAGLGYRVRANETTDKLGRIPMRQLVYRVQALPQSMLPLVWDFGQLNEETEALYIKQMVHKHALRKGSADGRLEHSDVAGGCGVLSADSFNVYREELEPLAGNPQYEQVISSILAASQEFMRMQQDECSFVSLRDVDRAVVVMIWFYQKRNQLFPRIEQKSHENYDESPGRNMGFTRRVDDDDNDDEDDYYDADNDAYANRDDEYEIDGLTRSLILALGVCYHACLLKREEYREFIAEKFTGPMRLPRGADTIADNISWCQDVFLDEIEPGENIAKNQALKENVFMMVVCVELRIPLFLVGKPGSSKSLAKTIVADAMQGEAAKSELFRTLKSVHMVSYQCSPLSTAEGIVGTFTQCAKLQQNQNLDKFVSVVVLDEVGLAEDSDRMPLKALHPLLEDGCTGDDEPAPHKKVGFIGISNWALDPAKMNRGILVQRGVPDEQELELSARGICAGGNKVSVHIESLLEPMSKAYLELYESALEIREFFGLRDFYSLVKMVHGFEARSHEQPTWAELQHAILRNFGGLDTVKPLDVFAKHLTKIDKKAQRRPTDPAHDPASLIRASLERGELNSESRYLLILTENYAALDILQNELLCIDKAIIIFGSSFPRDQEYTQVCRNINRIKICMETGLTVVLLNLENLYESLYDALNQYYVTFGDQRFVDLGLGTQRVKCRVHKDFRLIVVAQKDVVYKKFPIPLVNRLEKHCLAMSTMLSEEQRAVAERLQAWCKDFCGGTTGQEKLKIGDVFIGYHDDAPASIVLDVCQKIKQREKKEGERGGEYTMEQVMEEAKDIMLCCATPESMVRLSGTSLAREQQALDHRYNVVQKHSSIHEFLQHVLVEQKPQESLFAQITTHSRLLWPHDVPGLAQVMNINPEQVFMHKLNLFGTEQHFCRSLREFIAGEVGGKKVKSARGRKFRVLLLQCDSGDRSADLIACARYNIWNEYTQMVARGNDEEGVASRDDVILHVILVVQLPRIAGGCFVGFQGGKWMSYHIDDLHPDLDELPPLATLTKQSIGTLFKRAVIGPKLGQVLDQSDHEDSEVGQAEDMQIEEVFPPAEQQLEDQEMEEIEQLEERVEVNPESSGQKEEESGSPLAASESEALLDVSQIINNCIHGAMAMIREPASAAQTTKARKTQQLNLLLDLLKDGNEMMEMLRKRVTLLLNDREETVVGSERAKDWIKIDAASTKSICKAGTFRRSLRQCLESRVTPVLAGLIAYLAPHGNLELLQSVSPNQKPSISEVLAGAGSKEWIRDLWFSIMMDPSVTKLSYRDLQTAMRERDLDEFEIRCFGHSGSQFNSRLPFSWIIKSCVDNIVQGAKQEFGFLQSEESPEQLIERLLYTKPLGKILQNSYIESGGRAEVVKCYMEDFIHMVYTPQSSQHSLQEKQLIYSEIVNTDTQQKLQRVDAVDNDGQGITLVGVHLAYDLCHSRIELFSQLVQQYPECVPKLSQSPALLLVPIDLRALVLLMETLTPQKETMNNDNERKNWIDRVRHLSPLVSRLFESVSSWCTDGLEMEHYNSCRCKWSKMAVLQIFVDRVCVGGSEEEKTSAEKCMMLWNLLGDSVDFKKVQSLQKIEKFSIMCNEAIVKKYFGKVEKCAGCEISSGDVAELPCKHVICGGCLDELKELDVLRCPRKGCNGEFGENVKNKTSANKQKQMEPYKKYKARINLFYMDLVSRLCFSGDTPPDSEVVKKLMGYVTRSSNLQKNLEQAGNKMKTRSSRQQIIGNKIVMFEEGFEPTPVVRSLFLQLLLRSNIDEVKEHLEDFLISARYIMKSHPEQILELSLLCIHCFEDHYHGLGAQSDSELKTLEFASDTLLHAYKTQLQPEVSMISLEWMGRVRYCLSVTADSIYRHYLQGEGEEDRRSPMTRHVMALCDKARSVCEGKLKWPKIYLVKLLVRRYGMDLLRKIKDHRDLQWVLPPEALMSSETDNHPDRFIVLGEEYKKIRESLSKVLLGEDVGLLEDSVKEVSLEGGRAERLMLLGLYREVTSLYGHQDTSRRPDREMEKKLLNICESSAVRRNKVLGQQLITNQLDADWLRVIPHRDSADLGLAEIILHFKIVIEGTTGQTAIYKPFTNICREPQSMNNSFLPTMPQDDLEDVRGAFHPAAGENPVFYQCPNGHPYVIGNCGRPNVQSTCRACNAIIGGMGHNAAIGNILVPGGDRTRPGHVLGEARPWTSVPERGMSPASLAIMRLLLHMSMYMGAINHPREINQMIIPHQAGDQVKNFLWRHIKVDLDAVATAIGRSKDDVMVLLHQLIDRSSNIHQTYARVAGLDDKLRSKQSRQVWETAFADQNISALFQDINERLQEANKQIVSDDRLGNNPVMRLLYEVEGGESVGRGVEEDGVVWRYRCRVTIEHVTQELHGVKGHKGHKGPAHPVLSAFLRRERELRALRLLPSVLKLHQLLLHRLNRRIDQSEAVTTSINTFLAKHDLYNSEIKDLIDCFGQAWNYIRPYLDGFVFLDQKLTKDMLPDEITGDVSLAVLLPSLRGRGRCSLGLICYLMQLQNDFMEEYSKITSQKTEASVALEEVNLSHLISFHEQRDIEPIILANCNYSLQIGHGTKVEYDFTEMEAQITERFIRGRPRLRFQGQIDVIIFREDFTNAAAFNQLRGLIEQVPLTKARELESSVGQKLPEINDLMAYLDIVIGFLVSVGGDRNTEIVRFITETLHMKQCPLFDIIKSYRLKHVEALWMQLSFIRERINVKNGQETFESVDHKYRERLPQDVRRKLVLCLQQMNMEVFLPLLHKCILMRLTVKQDTNQEDYVDNADNKLCESLYTYMEEQDLDTDSIPALFDGRFPEEILVKHCVDTWRCALNPSRRRVDS